MDDRLYFPAVQRNKSCIGDLLETFLPEKGLVLEIASGSGEHAVFFQKRFQGIRWQTSDPEELHRKSISDWIAYDGLTNKMPQPIDIDVEKRPWSLNRDLSQNLIGIICINMIHISPWSCSIALFEESRKILKKDQFLIIYGPFKIHGKHISESNFLFDKALKKQNSSWGVRNLDGLNELASKNGFKHHEYFQMPANNFFLIYHLN